jgi:DNA invertase Pin-like site-specific DNA recombinase
MTKARIAGGRVDAVFIRKSTQGQDEEGQKANVRNMLKERGVYVPDAHWFVGTVGRRKVRRNPDFARLMELVEADRIGTVYVESQDRWGTGDRPELFSLLGTLREHDTRLYDLRAGKDLTEKDLATEMLAFVNSIKSEKELQDIAFRSLRTRVNNFRDTGSWPTGSHPYGYGKECRAADGKLLWVWQPVNRSRGQVFYPDAAGRLTPGPGERAHPPQG